MVTIESRKKHFLAFVFASAFLLCFQSICHAQPACNLGDPHHTYTDEWNTSDGLDVLHSVPMTELPSKREVLKEIIAYELTHNRGNFRKGYMYSLSNGHEHGD